MTKLDANGRPIYSTYLGGSGDDYGYGIAVDHTEAAYVTGSTSSADFPLKNGFQPVIGGGNDAFVTKLDAKGRPVYSTYLGGSGHDYGEGIAVDSIWAIYLTGITVSTDFPIKNAFQTAHAGGCRCPQIE